MNEYVYMLKTLDFSQFNIVKMQKQFLTKTGLMRIKIATVTAHNSYLITKLTTINSFVMLTLKLN